MKKENFKTEFEFKKKYPSGLYICSNCRAITTNKNYCQNCGWYANGLFKTMGNGYIYSISEINIKNEEIFQPLELFEIEKIKKEKGV